MKSIIGRKIFILIFVPFLIIFGVLSAYTAHTMKQYFINRTEFELKSISEINSAQLEGKIDSVRITVLSAANILDKIDPNFTDIRKQADETVLSMFVNESVYNAWLAFEPDAFDGKDKEHMMDYPGAPSGRFMLSYVIIDGQIIMAPDMDEDTIDNKNLSPWYTIPRDEKRLYIDVANSSIENLYDYGIGSELAYTLSVVSPVTKEGKVIGCVGADVIFDTMTFGIDNAKNAAVAVFYPDGRVFFAEDITFAEESLDTLLFIEKEKIKKAMNNGESLFLSDEYCPFLSENAFIYFHPIHSDKTTDSSLFLYVALPSTEAFRGLKPILIMVAVVAFAVLMVLLIIFAYVVGKISKPIRDLTLAANAISQGNIETEITVFSNSKDELGLLSQSLHRMVEQFRVYIIRQEQIQTEISAYTQIKEYINEPENITSTLCNILAILCRHAGMNKATAVTTYTDRAYIAAMYNFDAESKNVLHTDFLYHLQVIKIIDGKKLLYMNSSAIDENNISFIDSNTVSVCILPLRADNYLYGYIIFENQDKFKSFGMSEESLLIYVSELLVKCFSYLYAKTVLDMDVNLEVEATYNAELPNYSSNEYAVKKFAVKEFAVKENELSLKTLEVIQSIKGLDAVSAIEVMGGLEDIYEQSIKLFKRLLPETVHKLDSCLREDINTFAIEIHGLKGSLNNVGAYALGNEASQLEKAAKSGNIDFCEDNFPNFKETLMVLYQELESVFTDIEIKSSGDKKDLTSALEKASKALIAYDALEALDVMRQFMEVSFDAETDALLYEITCSLEIFDCENALESINKLK